MGFKITFFLVSANKIHPQTIRTIAPHRFPSVLVNVHFIVCKNSVKIKNHGMNRMIVRKKIDFSHFLLLPHVLPNHRGYGRP